VGVVGGDSTGESEMNLTWCGRSSGDSRGGAEWGCDVGAVEGGEGCGRCDFVDTDTEDCESLVGTREVPGVSTGVGR
jgi:hypothetical protein